MMKKLLLIIFLFILCLQPVHGQWPIVVSTVGGCDDCSGDLKFSWHFENSLDITSGTPCGCVDAGGDSTASANDGATFDGSIKSDGSYAGDYADNNDWHEFAATVQNFEKDEGKLIIDIYVTTFVQTDIIQIYHTASGSFLRFQLRNLSTDLQVRTDWFDATDHDYVTTPASGYHGTGEWLRLTYQWKQSASTADHRIELCDLTLPDSTSNCDVDGAEDDIGDWAGDADDFEIGVCDNVAADIHLDNLKVYATSGL